MSENAFKVPSIRDLPMVLQRQCVICDEIITERFSSQKDYVDAMAYNSAYVCKECKDAVKAMKRVKVQESTFGDDRLESFTFANVNFSLTIGKTKFVKCQFTNTTIVSPKPLSTWTRVRLWWIKKFGNSQSVFSKPNQNQK